MEHKSAWSKYTKKELDKVFAFAKDYKEFLSNNKTETEC